MTDLIYAFALLLVGALSFFLGLKLSDRYHDQAAYEQKIALQKQYARLTAGVDADNPAQPYVYTPPRRRKFSVDKSFIEHMQKNGSATVRVNQTDAV
jgi:hypothetical protein